MKIACNFSLELEQLIKENKVDIDYYKYPGLGFHTNVMNNLEQFKSFVSRLTKPVLLHGVHPAPHNLSETDLIEKFDFSTVNQLINITNTPGLSFHPSRTAIDPSTNTTELVNTIVKNVCFIKKHYSNMQFITLENVDGDRFGDLIKPEIFTEIIDKSDCGFLLDISHAVCATRYLNVNIQDYLKRLPLHKIYEIHINGWIIDNNNRFMAHTKITNESYDILKNVLEVANPKIITIEYGRSNDKISAGIPLLSPNSINEMAKDEIVEQVNKIKSLVLQ